ncbi:MAG: acyl-CoA thioesterase [Prevotellaceae bacterium]|jgi:acyl-CoA thioester hydrolase|nr:acyl-CoA thioesterase [Prevotellaceae bacterium]
MHKIQIQIRFSDIDRLGHVNNSIYAQYLDVARLDYMKHTIGKFIKWNEKTIVIVHTDNDFLIPILIDDTVFALTQVVRIGNRSITMNQQIVDDEGNIKAKSQCIFSTVDVQTNTSFPVPDEWKKCIEDFESRQA